MGQHPSANIHDIVDSIKTICTDVQTSSATITDDYLSISYDEFKEKLKDFNKLSHQCLDSTGNTLLFLIKKGSDEHVFWKITIRIACVRVDPRTATVNSYRLIDLKKFLQIYRTVKEQKQIADDSKSCSMNVSTLYNTIGDVDHQSTSRSSDVDVHAECCICLERKPDISLPCAHTYCLQCIEEWNEDHNTCPICREQLENKDDTWVLSEMPKAEEISDDIKVLLLDLASNGSS